MERCRPPGPKGSDMAVLCPEGQGHQAWDAGGVGRALPDVRMQPGLPSPKPQAWEPLGPALPWGWTSELYTLQDPRRQSARWCLKWPCSAPGTCLKLTHL